MAAISGQIWPKRRSVPINRAMTVIYDEYATSHLLALYITLSIPYHLKSIIYQDNLLTIIITLHSICLLPHLLLL